MSNFLEDRDEPEPEDGRDLAQSAIKKLHRRGPTRPDSLHKRAPAGTGDAAVRAMAMTNADRAARSHADDATQEIKKVLARGPAPLLPDTLSTGQARVERSHDATVQAVAKALGRPAPYADRDATLARVRALRRKGGRDLGMFRKGLPPQSANARNTSDLADTGAAAGVARQPVPGARTTRQGPPHSASISPRQALPTDEDETLKALKQIFKAGPQRLL
jgi:hypothetical protein